METLVLCITEVMVEQGVNVTLVKVWCWCQWQIKNEDGGSSTSIEEVVEVQGNR